MKSSSFKFFQFLWKKCEIMSNKQTTKSHSNAPIHKNDDNNNTTEINTESVQGVTSVEPNTNPIDKTLQKPIQIPESSCSEVFNRQVQNSSVERNKTSLKFLITTNSSWKKNAHDYNINEELKLQINYYENKNWNVINWYSNWLKLIKLHMILLHLKILNSNLQHQKKYHPNKLQDLKLPLLHNSFLCHSWKTKATIYFECH